MKLASNQVALRRETASIVVQWQELSLHAALQCGPHYYLATAARGPRSVHHLTTELPAGGARFRLLL